MYEVYCYDKPFYNEQLNIVQQNTKRKIFKRESIIMLIYIQVQRFIYDYIEINKK